MIVFGEQSILKIYSKTIVFKREKFLDTLSKLKSSLPDILNSDEMISIYKYLKPYSNTDDSIKKEHLTYVTCPFNVFA